MGSEMCIRDSADPRNKENCEKVVNLLDKSLSKIERLRWSSHYIKRLDDALIKANECFGLLLRLMEKERLTKEHIIAERICSNLEALYEVLKNETLKEDSKELKESLSKDR